MSLFQLPDPSASTLRSIALWRSDGLRQLTPRRVHLATAAAWFAAAVGSAFSVEWVVFPAALVAFLTLAVLPMWLSARRSRGIRPLPPGSPPAFAVRRTRNWLSLAVLFACLAIPTVVSVLCLRSRDGAVQHLAAIELYCTLGIMMFIFYLGMYGTALWATGLPGDRVTVRWAVDRPPPCADGRLGLGVPLMLVSVLSPYAAMKFLVLRELGGLDPLALGDHLNVLAACGYVQREASWISLTPAGRHALLSHVAALEFGYGGGLGQDHDLAGGLAAGHAGEGGGGFGEGDALGDEGLEVAVGGDGGEGVVGGLDD
jgi:hypothetical protein